MGHVGSAFVAHSCIIHIKNFVHRVGLGEMIVSCSKKFLNEIGFDISLFLLLIILFLSQEFNFSLENSHIIIIKGRCQNHPDTDTTKISIVDGGEGL